MKQSFTENEKGSRILKNPGNFPLPFPLTDQAKPGSRPVIAKSAADRRR